MTMKINQPEKEIRELVQKCEDKEMEGDTYFRGMTYEQGILAAIRWLEGSQEENPLDGV